MTDILLIMAVVLLIAAVVLLLMLLRKASQVDVIASRLDAFERAQERTERAVREEVAQSRDEHGLRNGKSCPERYII